MGWGFRLSVVYPPVGPEKVAEAVTKMITILLGGEGVEAGDVVFSVVEVLISLGAGVVRVRSPAAGVVRPFEVVAVVGITVPSVLLVWPDTGATERTAAELELALELSLLTANVEL